VFVVAYCGRLYLATGCLPRICLRGNVFTESTCDNILLEHPVAKDNNLICRGILEGATSYCVRKLLMCFAVTFLL
jgi:hypothetical protein